MTWDEYRNQNQLKGRNSKKRIDDHDKSLFVAWYNLYERPQKNLINEANKILNK